MDWRITQRGTVFLFGTAILMVGGCGDDTGSRDNVCLRASQHLSSCVQAFGGKAVGSSCTAQDQVVAEEVLSLSCDDLNNRFAQSDQEVGWLDEVWVENPANNLWDRVQDLFGLRDEWVHPTGDEELERGAYRNCGGLDEIYCSGDYEDNGSSDDDGSDVDPGDFSDF